MEVDLKNLTPDVRRLYDMREVIFDEEWLKNYPDRDLYYMYRKVKQENGLNHNITVIPQNMLGEEFVKTKGHVHIGAYQEVYTVLEGQAIFLMQKTKDSTVEDVFAIKAQKGESIVIPSNYGHITINPSKTESLKTGDWSSVNCKSDYSLFEKLRGACYYYTVNSWIKNENYKLIPELRFEEPLKKVPENLDFLKNG